MNMAIRPRSGVRRRFESLEQRCLLAADVFISEFAAANSGGLLDEDGDTSDWVEIFNAGPDDLDLSGWHLTDDADTLDKWSFPAEVLPVGEFLLVYASGKDRSTSGQQLHTNFRLGASGEYLGLVEAGSLEIVSQFNPQFPQQLTDISYGLVQDVEVDQYVEHGHDSSLLISTIEPAADWTQAPFDDSSWTPSTAAIGYQTTVPGFTVVEAKSSSPVENLAEATSVLSGNGRIRQTVVISPVVNFFDNEGGGGAGNFAADLAFPGDTVQDDDDFAIRATGTVTVPSSGLWTFGTNSDDGVRLLIDGVQVIDDDTLHAAEDRFGTVELAAGTHSIDLLYFERGGGGEVELFAAAGEFGSFTPDFQLVGGPQGLVVETSPDGGATSYGALIRTNVVDVMYEQTTNAYIRIPFDVADTASIDSLTLRMNYDDGFVAYLNGTEIARRNVSLDGSAAVDRPVSAAVLVEGIDITSSIDLLQTGQNILAIRGVSNSADSDQFLLAAELTEFKVATGDLAYFRTPTPGAFNPASGASEFLVNDVSLSQPNGLYESAFDVSISADNGTSIRYTTDGSAPTETNGTDYTAPITVDHTTTLRARSFKEGAEPSFVETATYIFLNDILEQSPNGAAPVGFPNSVNINGQELDYGMDPDIVDSPVWGPQMIAALTQVPTLSVVMDIDDLLGTRNGIYTHAQSHGKAWERPASLELINPDGSEGFQVEAGIRIRGGFSRSGANPKHAFRLFFRDEYGDSSLDFPLFGDEGPSSFEKIDLRTTQNYSWSFQGSSQNTFLRDIFSRDIQGLMGQPYTRGDYYHLYINGQYWGIYQTEERPEANYAASHFGGDADDYDVIKSAGSSGGYQTEATDGNLEAMTRLAEFFYQQNGLSDTNMEDYFRAQGMNLDGTRNPDYERLLDVDSIIDYMIITYYTSDADGPGSKFTRPRVNNFFGIYNRENPDGFKFFEHDSEHSLDTGNAAGANYNMVTPLTTGGAQLRYFNPHWMHEQLAENNSEYRLRFADAVQRHLFHDGVLTADNALEVIDARAAEFDIAIIAESARWGDAQRNTPYTKTTWDNAVNDVRDWIRNRTNVVIGQLRDQRWYIDPPQFIVNGQPQEGGPLDSKLGLVSTTGLEFNTVLDAGSVWSYLDDGSDQGTAWREVGFDDASWETGEAQLGYGDGDESTVVSFGPNANAKFATTYFRTSFSVDSLANVQAAKVRLIRDDGAIVYLNGEEIARSNLIGDVNFDDYAGTTVGGGDEDTFIEFEFNMNLLQEGNNEIAVEIHQGNAGSSDISFDLELLVGGLALNESAIYYTIDGSDPRLGDGQVNPNASKYNGVEFALAATSTVATRSLSNGEWSALNAAEFQVGTGALRGDLDLDGKVGFPDFLILSGHYGQVVTDPLLGDIDVDGTVSFSDFLILSGNFGKGRPAPPPTPSNLIDALFATEFAKDAESDAISVSLSERMTSHHPSQDPYETCEL